MRNQDGLHSLHRSLTGLPEWACARVMQQIRQLTQYEPYGENWLRQEQSIQCPVFQ